MNILVPNDWLKEHLITKASPKQIAEYLSWCSQSVEKIHQPERDPIYEIEVTTNRPDCLSVYGIARELYAILPRFRIEAKLKPLPSSRIDIPKVKNPLPLEVKIANPALCPRFTAIIFENITVSPSPKIIQDRLEKSGIRALNNVVDISNYLMLELGQPMHTFDYDKIKKAKMILRRSREGEKIITLDGQKRVLPEGTIVIEDGEKRIIDLCGIMGGENSAVDQNTKRVLLFVQTYDPATIRRTCQQLSFRTEAASRFEKGIEPEGVISAIKRAIQLFEGNCQAKLASNLIDIYPHPPSKKKVTLTQEKLKNLIGIDLKLKEAGKILEGLGFQVSIKKDSALVATVPHWRYDDISIPEDLVEEIARIYGYFNLPTVLLDGQIPIAPIGESFFWEEKIKNALKYWGFTEIHSYSLISEGDLKNLGIDTKACLKVLNHISEDWVYLRPTLIGSVLGAVAKNQNEFENINIFEIANIYMPTGTNKLPNEIGMLCGAISPGDFFIVKGIIQTLLEDLGINSYKFQTHEEKDSFPYTLFSRTEKSDLKIENTPLGILGKVGQKTLTDFGIERETYLFNLNLDALIKFVTSFRRYIPISKNPPVIEDLAFIIPTQTLLGDLIQTIKSVDPLISKVSLIDTFEGTKTFRIFYQDPQKTLSGQQVEKIRQKIIQKVERTSGAKLKTKQ